jgi:hypothetical protein
VTGSILFPDLLPNLAGFVGAAILVGAYSANQAGRLASADWRFPALNLLGSALILVSLFFAFNFPSFVIELVWSGVSLWGLGRALRAR